MVFGIRKRVRKMVFCIRKVRLKDSLRFIQILLDNGLPPEINNTFHLGVNVTELVEKRFLNYQPDLSIWSLEEERA
jgi:hypothetical protein